MKKFDSFPDHYFRFIIAFAVIQFGILLLSIILSLFSVSVLRWIILFLLVLDIFAISGLILFLFNKYKNVPIVKEKAKKQSIYSSLNSQLQIQQNELERTLNHRESIAKDEEKKSQHRINAHENSIAVLDKNKAIAEKQLADELASELSKIQARYIRDNMQNTRLDQVKIPGIGPKTKETLAHYGILAAADIDFRKITAISGFGESKANTLVAWRNETRLQITRKAPKVLPADISSGIQKKYDEYFESLKHQVNQENLDFKQDQQMIRTEAVDLQQENDEQEIKIKEIISGLEPDVMTAKEERLQYDEITFKHFVKGIINNGKENIPALKSIGPAPVMFVVAGMLALQTMTGFGAATNIIIDAIPTATFTATLTATASHTYTPSETRTATETLTPTITDTPTITNTPSITLTPTETLTPTVSNTPTVTLPAVIAGGEFLPENERVVAFVTQIIDGDTIGVMIDGYTYRVDYIGINAPEINEGYQPFGYEASIYNSNLVYGKYVVLIKDVTDVDESNQLLRYVIVDDKFVNYEMVHNGYAQASTSPPDVACASAFIEAQSYAKSNTIGLWAPTNTPVPAVVPINPVAPDYSVPAGATALCNDGTFSYSQNRSGTCSHHGGVAIWY